MFYDRFKMLCTQKGVSCNKAAIDMGLSNSTPTKWKKTGATPDSTTLAKISAYFNVSINELLTDDSTGTIEFTVSTEELQNYLKTKSKKIAPSVTGEGNTNQSVVGPEEIKAAFWGGDKDLSKEDMDAMWNDVKNFAEFIAQQKKQEKQNNG